jgi:hypothetical protein
VQSLGIALELAEMAGFEVEGSKRQLNADFWNTLDASKESLLGAFYCLRRNIIAPMANVPTEESTGWDFALWYAFGKAAKENEHADYICIPRRTNFLPAKGASWGASKQFTDLNRLAAFIRICAQKLSTKCVNPKKFLKGEGYFLEKYAGKKPFGGLYTNEEFILLSQDWEKRIKCIKDLYKEIPDKFSDSRINPGGLGLLMSRFNIKTDSSIKTIGNAAQARIPMLLVSQGSGKARRQVIAKGGNLPEKLYSINGGESVRTVGKVLWSPVYGIPQSDFIESAIRYGRNKISKVNSLNDEEDKLLDLLKRVIKEEEKIRPCYGALSTAATVYLEIYPDHAGTPAWDAALGPSHQ